MRNLQTIPASGSGAAGAWWLDVLPEDGFRYRLGTRPGAPEPYFAPTAAHDELLAERRNWLLTEPQRYAALLPEAAPLVDEALALAAEWKSIEPHESQAARDLADPLSRCLTLGMAWEPDFCLLRPDEAGRMKLLGGCVCFPSEWRLTDKIGRPLGIVHEVIPGLNAAIGDSIEKLLVRMKRGGCWLRANWSISGTNELNQHPDRRLPGVDTSASLSDIWLRGEEQAIVSLPATGGVLFGIRIRHVSFQEIRRDPVATQRLRNAIESLPPEVVRYKRIATARDRILQWLAIAATSPDRA